MHIIFRCTVLCMLILSLLCTDQEIQNKNIIFNPANVTAVPGLCALVSCTFNDPKIAEPKSFLLYKCKSAESGECTNKTLTYETTQAETTSESKRIKMLHPDLKENNCSFIIKNITADDEGEYEVRVKHAQPQNNTYSHRFKIIIQDELKIEVPPLRENKQANLSCSTPSPCPETPPNITWWIKTREGNITEMNENITLTFSEGFSNSTLTFIPTSELHNATVGCNASYGDDKTISTNRTIAVMYEPTLRILGNVREGDTFNLSCTVDSHLTSSDLKWTLNGTTDKLIKHISGRNLIITNVSTQHAGEYLCLVTYKNKTQNTSININVICKGIPENQTMTEKGMDRNAISPVMAFLMNLELISFLMGMATSAVIFFVLLCCWVCCNRATKPKGPGVPTDSAVNLQMVQTNIDLTVTNEQTPLHNQSDAGMSSTQVEMTGGAEDGEAEDGEAGEAAAGDVDYAAIDYSLLKNKSSEEEEKETVNTDYAEIKRNGKERRALKNEHEQTEDQKQNEEEF